MGHTDVEYAKDLVLVLVCSSFWACNTKSYHSFAKHFNPPRIYIRQLFAVQPLRSPRSSSALILFRFKSLYSHSCSISLEQNKLRQNYPKYLIYLANSQRHNLLLSPQVFDSNWKDCSSQILSRPLPRLTSFTVSILNKIHLSLLIVCLTSLDFDLKSIFTHSPIDFVLTKLRWISCFLAL